MRCTPLCWEWTEVFVLVVSGVKWSSGVLKELKRKQRGGGGGGAYFGGVGGGFC
jgi:hypothetical protein